VDGRDPGAALLLPRMRPIGDLDSDELSLVEEVVSSPMACADVRRRAIPKKYRPRSGRWAFSVICPLPNF
jgi:hypothetical protein